MSFLSALFGCNSKTIDIAGPGHESGKSAVIYIDQAIRIEYVLPGNITKQFGFDTIREKEEKTRKVDLAMLKTEDFEQFGWRKKKFIDAGRWDYLGPKNKGLAGELGWLNLAIELNKTELPKFSEAGIRETIKKSFLAYLEVKNKEIRGYYPGYSEENLAHALLPIPESFEWVDINGARLLTWLSNETGGRPTTYYVLPLVKNYFLSIVVSYNTSVSGDKLLEQVTQRIKNDASRILDTFVVTM